MEQSNENEIIYRGTALNIEKIIDRIIEFKDTNEQHLLSKFTVNYLISIIERDKITQLEKSFKEYDKKGVDIIDFVRIFLNIIEHQENETLFLVMSLVDFFRVISENLNMTTYVKYVDVTNFVCESFGDKTMEKYIIPTRKLPETKKFNIVNLKVRDIDVEAPVIYGQTDDQLKRLIKSKLITDSSHHNNHSIKMGTYSREIKKVFTLDSLSDKINIYSLDCNLEKTISPKFEREQNDVIIMSFAWSNRQQRIGATLKDISLSFWEAYDKFEFEKHFGISNYALDYQTDIWFIEFMNMWITTDKTLTIYGWDIEAEAPVIKIQKSDKIKMAIVVMVEIAVMRLVAVGTLDQKITVWDFNKANVVLTIDLTEGGIHSIVYFNSYQVLVSAGYENSISVFSINPIFIDHSLIGRLIGHNSMVTAIQCIERTPMLISADDNGVLKIWDIRSFKCIQTVDLGSKTVITRLLDIQEFGKICFIGSRVNFIEFDSSLDTFKNDSNEVMYPIRVEYNYLEDELVVCTRKDVRFFDLNNGRTKKVYSGLLENPDDEITIFRSVEQNKKFIIGDHRGNLNMFAYNTGELVKNLKGHTNEISSLKVDYANKLYVTASWDSMVKIQRESKKKFEVKRKIRNLFCGKEVSLMEISVYHNLLVTCSYGKLFYLWDYEYCRLLAAVELEDEEEPSCINFINGYSLLLIGTNKNRIYILHFLLKDQGVILNLRGIIDLNKSNKASEESLNNDPKHPNIINKLIVDVTYGNDETSKPTDCKILLALTRGTVKCYNLVEIFAKKDLVLIPHANKRINYNAYRKAKEDFMQSITKLKLEQYNIKTAQEKERENIKSFSNQLVNEWKAHRESLTSLTIITLSEKRVLSSSLDSYIRIWSLSGELIASLNINHPLPIKWTVMLDNLKRTRKNILFALKIVELIFRRYKRSILLSEEKLININNFLSNLALAGGPAHQPVSQIKKDIGKRSSITSKKPALQPINVSNDKKTTVMRDEFSPRDLKYDRIKQFYQKELLGPSLKEMEANKRVLIAQRQWKQTSDQEENQDKAFGGANKLEDQIFKEKDFIAFFDSDYRDKALHRLKNEEDYSERTRKLGKELDKMEKMLRKKRGTGFPKEGGAGTMVSGTPGVNNLNLASLGLTNNPSTVSENQQTAPRLKVQEKSDKPPQKSPRGGILESSKPTASKQQTKFKQTQVSEKETSFIEPVNHAGPNELQEKSKRMKSTKDVSQNLASTNEILSAIDEQQVEVKWGGKSQISNSDIDFYEYAQQRNLLESTLASRASLNAINVSKSTNSMLDERTNFHHIMKNLDKRLKRSQNTFQKIIMNKKETPENGLMDDSSFFSKPGGKDKGSSKAAITRSLTLPKIEKSSLQHPLDLEPLKNAGSTISGSKEVSVFEEKFFEGKLDEMIEKIREGFSKKWDRQAQIMKKRKELELKRELEQLHPTQHKPDEEKSKEMAASSLLGDSALQHIIGKINIK